MTIEKDEQIALSGSQMKKLTDGKARIMVYPDMYEYDNIDQILGPYGMCIILYETKHNYGHWTCIFKRDNKTLEFFDSYGGDLDTQLDFVPEKFAKSHHENHKYLMKLIKNSPYQLINNHYDFQKQTKGMSTCGRHVSVRLAFKDLPIDKYQKMITNSPHDPDYVVTYATDFI